MKNQILFLESYDNIFDESLKKFIAQIDVENRNDLWAKYDGLAIRQGEFWIGIYCYKRNCEGNRYHIKIRTIHGNSNFY